MHILERNNATGALHVIERVPFHRSYLCQHRKPGPGEVDSEELLLKPGRSNLSESCENSVFSLWQYLPQRQAVWRLQTHMIRNLNL